MNRRLTLILVALISLMIATIGSGPQASADTGTSSAPNSGISTSAGTEPVQGQAQTQPVSPTLNQDFQDVPTTNTFYSYIHFIYLAGIVSGYSCGGTGEPCVPPGNLPYYRPNTTVTRAQMGKFVDLARTQPGIAIDTSTSALPLFSNTSASNGYGIWAKADTGANARGVYGSSAAGTGVFGTSEGGNGVFGSSTATDSNGVYGVASTGSSASGVYGTSATGRGVFGVSTATDGQGVRGVANTGTSASGVYGRSTSGTGVYGEGGIYGVQGDGNYGVYGTSTYNGVYGVATGNGHAPSVGVWGGATNSNGQLSYGVYGEGDYAGIYGFQGSGIYAGYFNGDVNVTGFCCASGALSSRIDDPIDPANKYLSHSAVESQDMMNIYNGNVALDEKGEAVVQLPDWFEALNQDFRYQLTAIGAPGPNLYVAEEVKGNQFKIAGGQAGTKVSWQITGIRHDPYANAHPIPVEQDKPQDMQGKYLHPEELGQPNSSRIDYKP